MMKTTLASLITATVICASVAAPVFSTGARAQEAAPAVDTHLQAAIELVKETGTLPAYENQLKAIVMNSKRWLIRENPNAEKDVIAVIDTISEKFKDEEDQMIKAVAVAWARYLKEDELKEVQAFFKTDVGTKFANYQPRILGESLRGLKEFAAIMTNIIVAEAKTELNKKGYKFSQ